ncbi:hypothetical protein [Holdemania massiliensis]|uniref:hypothetical protein n=1 Tax=Holdemania massiliensis TaxID=1468449 RepID=UPI001F066035|nr:hypothetical protein [Holdemania massiliensis]MCH1939873.1 hypothetical protein [Holdemania massiliensis]
MHKLVEQIIKLGGIDTEITRIHIDEWFENATIGFFGNEDKEVVCKFKQCFEVSLKHDRNYLKERNSDDSLSYKYFIQDVRIIKNDEFYVFEISAWPLAGKIICKEICIDIQN